jgi:Tol biopolymer transport system component
VLPGLSVRLTLALAVVAAASAALVSASPVGGGHAAVDSSQLIAFARVDGIYVMHADGSGIRPLRRGGAARGASGLVWSPDGSRLAFLSVRTGEIWAVDADDSHLVRVAAGYQALSPTWSPDGRRIAFSKRDSSGRDIWVMNADGSNQQRLARTDVWEFELDWSPSGKAIAFSDYTSLAPFLGVVSTRAGTAHVLTAKFVYDAATPRWSPNARLLAFTRWQTAFHTAEIYLTSAGGDSQVRLTHNGLADGQPTWSPDGKKIAFVRWRGSPRFACVGYATVCGPSDIYVMNADGTGVTRLTHTPAAEGNPAWQPMPSP